MTSFDESAHLRKRLAQSMEAASLRISELDNQVNAYQTIIESFDRRIVELKGQITLVNQSLIFWRLFALGTAVTATIITYGTTRIVWN